MSHLEDMGKLRTLRLDSNKIKNIPEDIVKLLNLERLDLSCNELTKYVIDKARTSYFLSWFFMSSPSQHS